MAVLSTNQAVTRFNENENRVDTFVNQDGFYTTNETSPRQVETLPSFLERIDNEFDAKMITLGYDFSLGSYAAGKVFTAREMVILYSGEYYKVKASTSIPFTTTGTWATDSTSLVAVGDAVLRADLASTSEGNGAELVGYMPAGTGAVATDVQSQLRGHVLVRNFLPSDYVTDGSVDYTTCLQKALDEGANSNRMVDGENLAIRISGPVTVSGPGLTFDLALYGNVADPGIYVTGTGYTAVTFSQGIHNDSNIAVYGTGNAANGVLIQNNILSSFKNIRASNLAGFGVKINKTWDSTYQSISVELCGTASEYAFSMNDDGDTCNMSHINRLQVERSNQKAIYISPNTLSCVIDNIHSERQTPEAGVATWVLGGNRCIYNGIRLDSLSPSANATAILSAAQTQYNTPLIEGDIVVKVEGYSSNTITIVNPEFQGVVNNVSGQSGTINIIGGLINTLHCAPLGFKVNGTNVSLLKVDWANSDPKSGYFTGCVISELQSVSTQSAATFTDCFINTHNDLLQGVTVLKNSYINNGGATTLNVSYRALYCVGLTVINAPVSIDNGTIVASGTTFGSTLTQTAGPITSKFADDCESIGAVSGIGALTGGVNNKGARTKNMAPAVGSPKAWVCTVSGSPGTWVSEGNL